MKGEKKKKKNPNNNQKRRSFIHSTNIHWAPSVFQTLLGIQQQKEYGSSPALLELIF
jgi:hypothetical protein